jgi:hypothetical protein
MKAPYTPEIETRLMSELWDPALKNDLYAWAKVVWPWKEVNTPLREWGGPKVWQRDLMDAISEFAMDNLFAADIGRLPDIFRGTVCSGRGIGKSALVAQVVYWFFSTRIGSTTIVTANSQAQLESRTWPELGKWHSMAINRHWFDRSALSMKAQDWFADCVKTQLNIDTGYYYVKAQTWSVERAESFCGAHSQHGMMVVFDEASGIDNKIWDVTPGFFTDPIPDRYWLTFSNGRNTDGMFYLTHEDPAISKQWNYRRNIDSRTVEGLDRALLDNEAQVHGEDSDWTRVEICGLFPHGGTRNFISRDLVDEASIRKVKPDQDGLIMGIDVARFGADYTVFTYRKGRDARSIPPEVYQGEDNVQIAKRVVTAVNKYNPKGIVFDAGNASGVIDILRSKKMKVEEIYFASKATDTMHYWNRRTELYALAREWLKTGYLLDNVYLKRGLTEPGYDYRGDILMLEPKDVVKKRVAHTSHIAFDYADSFVVTFAINVPRDDVYASGDGSKRVRVAKGHNYLRFGRQRR